jgi:hypothetical protein
MVGVVAITVTSWAALSTAARGFTRGGTQHVQWLRARCGNIRFDFAGSQFFIEYLPDSDELFGMDVYWHRAGS